MKTCPFCKEEVNEDAIKCRYCHSFLLPIQPEPQIANSNINEEKAGTVTYILDKDLIRFGKFGFFILGLFTIVGIYLYGIDIKEVSKTQNETKAKLEELKKELEKEQLNIKAANLEITKGRTDIKKANDTFKKGRAVIEKQNSDLHQKLTSTANKVDADSKKSNFYLNSVQGIYKKMKYTIEPQAEALLENIAGKTKYAEGTPITQESDLTFSILSGAEITTDDSNSYGRIGYYLIGDNGDTYGVCSYPIFPLSNQKKKEVYIISKDKSRLLMGSADQQSTIYPLIGLVKINNFKPQNAISQDEKIHSFLNRNQIRLNTEVFLKSGDSTFQGIITDVHMDVTLDLPNGSVLTHNVIMTSIKAQPGLVGSLLFDKNYNAIGILVGATNMYSFYIPISDIIEEFHLKPLNY